MLSINNFNSEGLAYFFNVGVESSQRLKLDQNIRQPRGCFLFSLKVQIVQISKLVSAGY